MIRSLWDSYNAKGYGAMPLRGHSAGLRPEPPAASQPKAAAVIAGALRDWRGLSIVGLILALAVLA